MSLRRPPIGPAGFPLSPPRLGHVRAALAARDAGTAVVSVLGRIGIVWLAIAVIVSSERPLTASGIVGVSVATLLWAISLQSAFAAVELSLGVAVPALLGTWAGLVLVAAVNSWTPGLDLGLATLLPMAAGVFASATVWESAVARVTSKRRILVIGSDAMTDIAAEVGHLRRARFEVLAPPVLEQAGDGKETATDLAMVIRMQRPSLVVLADEPETSGVLDRLLDMPRVRFRLADMTSFYEYAFGRVPLTHLTPLWFMSLLELGRRDYGGWSKRAFDIGGAVLGLVLTAPLMALIALAVRTTGRPVIFRQIRVGEGGRRFTMVKFRTMRTDAERQGGARWAADRDERATPLGLLLRSTHLDELPQLWNVLRGDMSLVGPRPERPEFIAQLEQRIPFWQRRLLVKPGMTGWAQLSCGYTADIDRAAEKLSYDFWYIRHRTMVVDLALCVRTVLLVLAALNPASILTRRRTAATEGEVHGR